MSATRRTRKVKMRRQFFGRVAHNKEVNFLVGNRATATVQNEDGDTNDTLKAPPVSLISVSIPVQFQITNVMDWAYNNADQSNLLEDLATRDVVHFLAGVDLNDVMSHATAGSRAGIAEANSGRGQRAPAGRENSFCRFARHPSAGDGCGRLRESRRRGTDKTGQDSRRAGRSHPHECAGRCARVHDHKCGRGDARCNWLEVSAWARAALFTNQIPAFEAAPSVYEQRAYFQVFADATANARKYVLLVTNTDNVLIFDLEDKIREDLLNMNVPSNQSP